MTPRRARVPGGRPDRDAWRGGPAAGQGARQNAAGMGPKRGGSTRRREAAS
jgi:hypothetical protein